MKATNEELLTRQVIIDKKCAELEEALETSSGEELIDLCKELPSQYEPLLRVRALETELELVTVSVSSRG